MMTHFFGKLTAETFSERIVDRIQALILSRQLLPGDRLPPERDLAGRFGVSRTAVREALKVLAERGLLESRTGLGTFVSCPDLSSVTTSIGIASATQQCTFGQLHAVRELLEVCIAGLATEHATPADISHMATAIAVMDANLQDSERYIEADLEFHAALATATGNPFFLILSYPLIDLIQNQRRAAGTVPGALDRAQAGHRRLLECVKQKNPSEAREAMREHLDQVSRELEATGVASVSAISYHRKPGA